MIYFLINYIIRIIIFYFDGLELEFIEILTNYGFTELSIRIIFSFMWLR